MDKDKSGPTVSEAFPLWGSKSQVWRSSFFTFATTAKHFRSVQPQVDGTYLSLSRNGWRDKESSLSVPFFQGSVHLQGLEDRRHSSGLVKHLHRGLKWSIWGKLSQQQKMQRPQCNPTQVANDLVNSVLHPYVGQHSSSLHHTSFTGDFWLDYPNPLPPNEYPAFSSGPQYQGRFMIFWWWWVASHYLEPNIRAGSCFSPLPALRIFSILHYQRFLPTLAIPSKWHPILSEVESCRWVMLAAGPELDLSCPGWRWAQRREVSSTLLPLSSSQMWISCPASCWAGWLRTILTICTHLGTILCLTCG